MGISAILPWFRRHRLQVYLFAGFTGLALATLTTILVVRYLKQPVIPAEQAIPAETAWYIRFNRPMALWDRLQDDSPMAREALQFDWFREIWTQTFYIDSLVRSDAEMLDLCREQPLIVSCRYRADSRPDYLFLMNLPDAHEEKSVNTFISRQAGQASTIIREASDGLRIYSVQGRNGQALFFAVPDGIVLMSRSEEYLSSAIDQLRNGKGLSANADFTEVRATTGQNVDANIYFRLDHLKTLIGHHIPPSGAFVNQLTNTGDWAGMDLQVHRDELWMSGYINFSAGDYMALFQGEIPQKTTLPRMVPFNTAVMISFSTDRLERLSRKMREYHRTLKRDAAPPSPADTTDSDELLACLGREAAIVITENARGTADDNTFGIFDVKNRDRALTLLESWSEAEETLPPANPEEPALTIRKLKQALPFSHLFGPVFQTLDAEYYIILDHHVIFARQAESLRRYIASVLSGKTLDKNENYQGFATKVSEKAAACLYVNIRKSIGFLSPLLSEKSRRAVEPLIPCLRNFQAFAVQIAPEGRLSFVNMYLRYNPSYKDENPAVWEARLDTTAACSPVILRESAPGKTRMAVYDIRSQLYLIDELGRITRKIPIPGRIQGPLKALQHPTRNTSLLLFNTRQAVYLLSADGKALPGFPLITSFPVTNEVSVTDYANNGDLRIFVVCDDHRLYNFTGNGKPVKGWQAPRLPATVSRPLVRVRMLNKDYLILTDDQGRAHFFDRYGRRAFIVKDEGYQIAPRAPFYCYEDGSRTRIITVDTKGRILRFAGDGRWESLRLGDPDAVTGFLLEDFNGDGHKDYLLATARRLRIYNSSKKNLLDMSLPEDVRPGLYAAGQAGNVKLFGLVSENGERLLLFSRKGWLAINKDLRGQSNFEMVTLGASKYPSLLTSYQDIICHYYLYDLSFVPFQQ